MTVTQIENQVRVFIAESFLPDGAGHPAADDDLFALLDSLQILRLVVWVEERFGVKVGDEDLTAENLETPRRVAAFIGRRVAGTRAAG
jgi:acyl carrier protein